ncbi:BtpA family membrane complex biogenesis protein [Ancylomarina euxinus]|uniref:BtpA family membrane complex biogenesis protein n=1 Tax=Ancylomarina euxinus TaxID=2283627 RepID=A0A425Y877_9BACT|nr:BtpA/SgcQ family protein [Ancylomarina euxinus]MCZ4693339.1 BtpA/SgcQ family protein [Ancylomarina euxinus]MUP13567.1 BtpA/SgcQ family protein [Ancylomarina euxinus]RRG24785.1 BtpA family membrane complex biogenesis protein [Ancylomarina euxinus]
MMQFSDKKLIIGMIHVQALPGTPNHKMNLEEISELAVKEARQYENAKLDALIIENMHDVPYLKGQVGPEITAAMTLVAKAIRDAVNLPLGIQILAGANKEALAVAKSANLDFIRAEGFVFGHVADEGYIDSCAAGLMRYRKMISADKVKVFTDIKKKHSSHAITSDVDIVETAHAAEFFLSDGIIVTGSSTGKAVDIRELDALKDTVRKPILIGSGITADNISEYWDYANAFIVGSHFKESGYWMNPISDERLSVFMEKVDVLRSR